MYRPQKSQIVLSHVIMAIWLSQKACFKFLFVAPALDTKSIFFHIFIIFYLKRCFCTAPISESKKPLPLSCPLKGSPTFPLGFGEFSLGLRKAQRKGAGGSSTKLGQ